jgi:hypothetical protein
MKNKKTVWVYFLLSALLFCKIVAAQLPVREPAQDKVVPERDEPHHKVVFENEFVRLVEGHVRDHDTTLKHIHTANSVVVFLSASTLGIQVIGEKPIVTNVSPGDIVYRAYGDKPVTHIVWNQSKSMLHFFVVEMTKKHRDNDTCAILSQPGVTFQWQQPFVRAYYLDIGKDKQYRLPKSNCAYLLIDVSGTIKTVSSGGMRPLQADDFVFFPPRSGIAINGGNKENAHCVLLEFGGRVDHD